MATQEEKYVWVLEADYTTMVFIGFDHVRRTSKTYESMDGQKIISLANRMAKQHKTDVIFNFVATILPD